MIKAKLTASAGTNSCEVLADVGSPRFDITPLYQEGGSIVDFGSYTEFTYSIINSGSVSGTVRLKVVGDGWTIIPVGPSQPEWTLASMGTGTFKIRFTANTGAFQNIFNKKSGNVYQFTGIVQGDGRYVSQRQLW